jgi:hypothetical protein
MSEFQVAILTHESTEIPFEQTTADLLTQFFVSVGARLHTSILVEGLEAVVGEKRGQQGKRLPLVDHGGYKKECVGSTAQFQGQEAEVVIALCHGASGFRSAGKPSALHFRCDGRSSNFEETDVFANHYARKPDAVTLHSVIGRCKLAILLTCCGDQLVTDYVMGARSGQDFPDLLVCQAACINTITVEIYMVLIMNILDSNIFFKPKDNAVYEEVFIAIKMIFQIVKLFRDDHYSFWLFLKHVGCITDNTDEKNRQELEYPRRLKDKSYFRVYGRACVYETQPFQSKILQDFQNMRLIRAPEEKRDRPDYVSHLSVPDLTFQYDQLGKINCFLKRYHEAMQITRTPIAVSRFDHQEDESSRFEKEMNVSDLLVALKAI